MDIAHLIQNIAIYALPVIFAITVHEAAHGYAARHFGDDTAWMLGRITLNPLKHIDPFGTILLPLALILLSSPFIFGAAKPVPVNFGRLRNPKKDMVWVAFAGPASNLAMALLWGIALYLLAALGVSEPYFLKMCKAGMVVNVALFAFNMLPLPPLDGGRVAVGLLPMPAARALSRVEGYTLYIFLGMLVLSTLNIIDLFQVFYLAWMQPVLGLAFGLLDVLLMPFAALLT